MIALIVGSLGVAMAMYSHLQQRMDTIAVMKAVGARSNQILQIYLLQTLWLGVAGGLIGVVVGALVQKSFPFIIQRVFSLLPQVAWDWSFSLQGMSLGILATLLFTLPPLLSIRNVRPSLVFRRDMADAAIETRKHWREKVPSFLGALAHSGRLQLNCCLAGRLLENGFLLYGWPDNQHSGAHHRCGSSTWFHAQAGQDVEQASAASISTRLRQFVQAGESSPIRPGCLGSRCHVYAQYVFAAADGSAGGN